MNEFALHAPTRRTGLRWTMSAIVIVAVHAGLIAGGFAWYREHKTAGGEMPAIMVDMAPAAAAPELSQQDIAPGPEMQQAEAPSEPPPEPVQPQQMEEQVAPTPPVEKPVVEAPPEQKIEPTPPPPEPARITPEKPKPIEKPKPRPVRPEVKKKPSEAPPAPRTTAPQRSDRQAQVAATASTGAAAAAARSSYFARLTAHLQRYKEYPSAAKAAGKEGVARLAVTVSRSGQVLSSRLSGSSGTAELDADTLALIRRAQPLPAFPPEMTQASETIIVPVRYSIR